MSFNYEGSWGNHHITIAGVDAGRNAVKGAFLNRDGVVTKDSFSSLYADYRDQNFESNSDKNMVVQINGGKKYFVGKLARNAGLSKNAFQDEKAHDVTIMLILTALHRLGVDGNVKLVTCVPVTNHKADSAWLKHNLTKQHRVILNDVERRINITDVLVIIEGGASYYSVPEIEVEGKIARFINIGSAKSNFATFDEEGDYMDAQSGSLDEIGWNRFTNKVDEAQKIEEVVDTTYQELSRADWGKPVIGEHGEELEEVIYLCGGVAEKLLAEFKTHFPAIKTHPDPLYSDVQGCVEVGLLTWGK